MLVATVSMVVVVNVAVAFAGTRGVLLQPGSK